MRPELLVVAFAACAGSTTTREKPKSWTEHMMAADQHEQAAANHERAASEKSTLVRSPDAYRCGDTTLNDQLTTGGERVSNWVPCWDLEEEDALAHSAVAANERKAARQDRAQAVALANAELAHCKGMPPGELGHSPFAHRKAITQVIPHRRGGDIHGARIIFKPVPGLTAGYMRQAIACHQARFAVLGKPATYLPDDPTLVEGAEVTVTDRDGHLEVFVRTDSDVAGAVAYARAQDLLSQRTATK